MKIIACFLAYLDYTHNTDTRVDTEVNILLYIKYIDNQQRPTVYHKELYSVFCNNLYGKRICKRMNICICITESLCCTSETNTTS